MAAKQNCIYVYLLQMIFELELAHNLLTFIYARHITHIY